MLVVEVDVELDVDVLSSLIRVNPPKIESIIGFTCLA